MSNRNLEILQLSTIQASAVCQCGNRHLVLDIDEPTTCTECGRRYDVGIVATVTMLPRPGICADDSTDAVYVCRAELEG
jgi:hypothetical protein